ncbi:hypothetical protein MMC30_007395 [Trapelia coarctata]|nr:hypothetical protein [Trapelia coarctata]
MAEPSSGAVLLDMPTPFLPRPRSNPLLEGRSGEDIGEDAAAQPEELFAAAEEVHEALGRRLVVLMAAAQGFVAAEEAAGEEEGGV